MIVDRRARVARLFGVAPDAVQMATVAEMRQALGDRIQPEVCEVLGQPPEPYAATNPPILWRLGDRFILDDPWFGQPVDVECLAYDTRLGLHVREA